MELSSSLAHVLQLVEANPMWVVMVAGFGGFPVLILLALFAGLLRLLGLSKVTGGLLTILFATVLFSWFIGFVTQVGLFFLGTPGIKMLFIWLVMFLLILTFCILNQGYIRLWVKRKTDGKPGATATVEPI